MSKQTLSKKESNNQITATPESDKAKVVDPTLKNDLETSLVTDGNTLRNCTNPSTSGNPTAIDLEVKILQYPYMTFQSILVVFDTDQGDISDINLDLTGLYPLPNSYVISRLKNKIGDQYFYSFGLNMHQVDWQFTAEQTSYPSTFSWLPEGATELKCVTIYTNISREIAQENSMVDNYHPNDINQVYEEAPLIGEGGPHTNDRPISGIGLDINGTTFDEELLDGETIINSFIIGFDTDQGENILPVTIILNSIPATIVIPAVNDEGENNICNRNELFGTFYYSCSGHNTVNETILPGTYSDVTITWEKNGDQQTPNTENTIEVTEE